MFQERKINSNQYATVIISLQLHLGDTPLTGNHAGRGGLGNMTHQKNGKMGEMITATFHFLCSLIDHSAVAAVPCTEAICINLKHIG